MSEKHQMPGYRPSPLGLATKVRIGEPGIEMSAYSVVTIICFVGGKSGKEAWASQLLINSSSDSVVSFSLGQLHSLAALLNKLGDQSRPSGLVARSSAGAIVAMKEFMKVDEVARFLRNSSNRKGNFTIADGFCLLNI